MTITLNADEYIPTQREEIRKEIDKILDGYMESLVNGTIIAQIKSVAQAANLPQGFIDGVKFVKTKDNAGEVINTWGSKDKPLARWFNYGTTRHWIEPKNGKVLAWKGKSGSHAQAIYFQGTSKEGDMLYSKGHYVSGVPRTEAMEIGFTLGKKLMAREAAKIVEQELR